MTTGWKETCTNPVHDNWMEGDLYNETLGKLILPEVFEAVRRQGRVADRGHDRAVAEIGLDGARVVAVVGELEPAGVPQHVGMHEEREFRSHARPGNHALISGYGQRRVTLRDEDVWGRCGFAQELAQRAAPRRVVDDQAPLCPAASLDADPTTEPITVFGLIE